MSYYSRVYRHHNPKTNDENRKGPFFTRQNDMDHTTKRTSFFQAKLSVNEPGDKYEREADSVANAVVHNMPLTPVVQQKKLGLLQQQSSSLNPDLEKEKKKGIQKMDDPLKKEKDKKKPPAVQAKQDPGSNTAPPTVSSKIENSAGKGNRLPKNTLSEMSSSFGVDFSNVKVHNDKEAANMNQELQALAFTHGRDIYFNEGKFNPESTEGKFLLAHELTHVVQQEMNEDGAIQKSPAAAVAIAGALVAAVLCSYAFFEYALNNFPDKNDKWKHCWVSCKITAWCGGDAIALIIGAGKEGLDAICDAYGKGCKAEFMDFLADVEGIGCGNIPFLPCTTCCDNSGTSLL